MADFDAHVPDRDAVYFEFRARQLVAKLHCVRDCIMSLKEEGSEIACMQYALSKKEHILMDFTLLDASISKLEDELANTMFLLRDLRSVGRGDSNPGVTEQDF